MASVANVDFKVALQKFGLSDFRKGQREVIDHLMAGNDCLCVMPTGGGKSLCYQLPSALRSGLTIVVSPLIALMKDQVDTLIKKGISATLINSSLSQSEQNYRLERVAGGHYSLVYVAPERLRNPTFLEAIRTTPVQLLAIDEAHCISEWGHDFRPDYQRVGRFREALGGVQTIALTATATPKVRQDIVDSLKLKVAKHFITGFARDNLFFGVVQSHSDREKDKKLLEFLERRPGGGIIYAATRKRCEALVEMISKELQISVGAYHAGLMPDQRKLIQDQFMRGELDTIVATNAFGMGIDKRDLRFVVHYNMPGTLEAYYQEAGRAGRDGLASQCVLLFSAQDRYIQEFFIENANPSKEILESVYDFLHNRTEDPIELTAEEIKEQSNTPATAEAVNSALQILGRTDVLERLEVAGGLAMVRIDSKLPTLLDLLPKEATVKRAVLRTVEKAIGDRREEAVYVNPRWLMQQLQMERDAVSRHLRELCSLPGFEYVPPFRGRAIHFRKRDVPFSELKIDHDHLAARKKADYEKLDQMVAFANSRACRQKAILQYFGDNSAANCNICDRCQGKAGWPSIPEEKRLEIEERKKHEAALLMATEPVKLESAKSKSASTTTESHVAIATPTKEEKAKSKSASPSKAVALSAASPVEQEQARAGIQRTLGAIERTHGYLSKTILSQFFSGQENRAIQGLRLQRLPEFALLQHWKKSHVSSFLDLLLDKSLLILTELRVGKVTVSVGPFGLDCMHGIATIPEEIVGQYCNNERQSASEKQPAPPRKANGESSSSETPAERKVERAEPAIPVVFEPTEIEPKKNREPLPKATSKPPEVESETQKPGDEIRNAEVLPTIEVGDANRQRDPMSATPHDWLWTLRLAQHGYRLGEIALIRGKQPDQVLSDLCRALEEKESVPIEQLFDRRTQIAIKDFRSSGSSNEEPPMIFMSFPMLWDFVKRWASQPKA